MVGLFESVIPACLFGGNPVESRTGPPIETFGVTNSGNVILASCWVKDFTLAKDGLGRLVSTVAAP